MYQVGNQYIVISVSDYIDSTFDTKKEGKDESEDVPVGFEVK